MLFNKKTSTKPAQGNWVTLCLWLVALAMIGCPIACGGGNADNGTGGTAATSTPQQFGRATVSVNFPKPSRLIPSAAQSILINVMDGTKILSSLVLVRPAEGGTVTATFDKIPVGAWTATATAYPNGDDTGTPQAAASVPLNITKGTVTPFSLTMNSTIDKVVLSPSDLSLPIGQTKAMTATPQDTHGATVLVTPDTLTWQSSNPAVATVDKNGVLAGITLGSTTVTATETESGKTATITVNVVIPPTPSPSPLPSATPGNHQPNFAQPIETRWDSVVYDRMFTGDFDNDGKLDIVTNSGICYGRGDGTFETEVAWSTPLSAPTYGMLTGVSDINNDGFLDVIVSRYIETVSIQLNKGGRSFSPITSPQLKNGSHLTAITDVEAIQLAGQPYKSLAVSGDTISYGSSLHILRFASANYLEDIANYPLEEGYATVYSFARDLDNDGIQDLSLRRDNVSLPSHTVSLKGKADGTLAPFYEFTTNGSVLTDIADFNADNKPDFVISAVSEAKIGLLTNQSPSVPSAPTYYDSTTNAASSGSADFNRDGLQDIVLKQSPNRGNGIVIMWNRNGSFTPISLNNQSPIRAIATGDFNRDGKVDIVTANYVLSGGVVIESRRVFLNTTP